MTPPVITLYWVTGTIGSSFRSYYDDDQAPPLPRVDVPAGIPLTPEGRDYSREYAERSYRDIRQWTGPTRGGHFLALEEPGLLAADLRAFFRPLRGNRLREPSPARHTPRTAALLTHPRVPFTPASTVLGTA